MPTDERIWLTEIAALFAFARYNSTSEGKCTVREIILWKSKEDPKDIRLRNNLFCRQFAGYKKFEKYE